MFRIRVYHMWSIILLRSVLTRHVRFFCFYVYEKKKKVSLTHSFLSFTHSHSNDLVYDYSFTHLFNKITLKNQFSCCTLVFSLVTYVFFTFRKKKKKVSLTHSFLSFTHSIQMDLSSTPYMTTHELTYWIKLRSKRNFHASHSKRWARRICQNTITHITHSLTHMNKSQHSITYSNDTQKQHRSRESEQGQISSSVQSSVWDVWTRESCGGWGMCVLQDRTSKRIHFIIISISTIRGAPNESLTEKEEEEDKIIKRRSAKTETDVERSYIIADLTIITMECGKTRSWTSQERFQSVWSCPFGTFHNNTTTTIDIHIHFTSLTTSKIHSSMSEMCRQWTFGTCPETGDGRSGGWFLKERYETWCVLREGDARVFVRSDDTTRSRWSRGWFCRYYHKKSVCLRVVSDSGWSKGDTRTIERRGLETITRRDRQSNRVARRHTDDRFRRDEHDACHDTIKKEQQCRHFDFTDIYFFKKDQAFE